MELKEFVLEIAKGVEARLEGVRAIPTESMKNNGIIQSGLTLRMKDESVSPILYMNYWYDRFKRGELTMSEVVEKIITEYEELPEPDIPDFNEWISGVELLDRIKIRLVNRKRNEGMIAARRLVSYELESTDLVALFYLNVMSNKESVGEIAINEEILEKFLPSITSEKELYYEVLKRVKKEDVNLKSMRSMIKGLLKDSEDVPEISMDDTSMFVLTNKNMLYGVSMILTEAVRQMILEKIPDGRVTVLPSSIHECILIPTSADEDVKELEKMVRQINATEISREEFLSDNIYHYDANISKFEMVSSDAGEE